MRLLRNEKGFTLIELMIVIAVIGILAVTLLPKIASMKTNAKLTGIDANVRTVEGTVNALINKYANDATSGVGLRDKIVANLNQSADLVNPFNNANTLAATGTTGNNAVLVNVTTAPTAAIGLVGVRIVLSGTNVASVVIQGYDEAGAAYGAAITVTP